MTKWLFSLLIMLALGNGALAGTPLRSGSDECAMSAMSKIMNCCKRKSAGQNNPKDITRNNLCRALMCEQSGSTAASVQLPQLSTLAVAFLFINTLKSFPSKKVTVFKRDFSGTKSILYQPPLFLQNNTFRI